MKEQKIIYILNNKKKELRISLIKKIIEINKIYKYPFIENGFIIDRNKIYNVINPNNGKIGIIFKNCDSVLIVEKIENGGDYAK